VSWSREDELVDLDHTVEEIQTKVTGTQQNTGASLDGFRDAGQDQPATRMSFESEHDKRREDENGAEESNQHPDADGPPPTTLGLASRCQNRGSVE